MTFFSKYRIQLFSFFSILSYFYIAYFLERTNFTNLISIWIFLFFLFYFLINDQKVSFKNLAGLSIIFRLVFLFATPNLSQDFYRFIWDGRMIFEGFNPYLSLPETFIQQGIEPINNAKLLYENMGELNGSHYTNYPPLNQLNFFLGALFSNNSILGTIVVFRLQIILADLGILYFGSKLLELLYINKKNIFWYVLNPFIIIEMTGNLHFEPVMLFFFIFALYKLHQQKWLFAAFLMACSISVKLIPLLFLPLLIRWFIKDKANINFKSIKNIALFYILTIFISILFFLPFYSSSFIENYFNSVGLWFRNFEFNASLYYVFREIGYLFRGYNEIAILGKIAPIITIITIFILSIFKKNDSILSLSNSMLITICVYYFLSTTVHPWYAATPLLISIFTRFRFSIIWTFSIILSYQAYANNPWQENLLFVSLEYLILFSFLVYELRNRSSKLLII